MKPPANVSASKLWLKLQETPAPSEVVDFPRRRRDGSPVGQVRIMVLPQSQHDEARERAAREMAKRGHDPTQLQNDLLREVQGDLTAKELLALAVHEVEPFPGKENSYPKVFGNGADVGALTADEINVLFTQYLMVQSQYGPYMTHLSEDEVTAWIQRLVEGGSYYPLASCTWEALVRLCMMMAKRVYRLTSILGQLESLPSITESERATLIFDTSFAGKQLGEQSSSGTADDDEDDDVGMTAEEAAAIAREMHKSGGRLS